MGKYISQETITQVQNVQVYDLAVAMGFYIKSSGVSWNLNCPNPNHGLEKKPEFYIKKTNSIFTCFGGGGCGCKGSNALQFYSWSQFGEWDKKKYFYKSIIGVAEIMNIPIVFSDNTRIVNTARPQFQPRPAITVVEPQSDDVCDRVYRRFLNLCPIYEEHVHEWRSKRQYTNEEIVAIGLRSVPRFNEVNRIVAKLREEGYSLERIPGFTQRLMRFGDNYGDPDNEKHWYWTFSPFGKYFIPIRNELGQIIRLRISTGQDKPKYTWFGSEPNIQFEKKSSLLKKGGAPSFAPLNIVPPYQVLQSWKPGEMIADHLSCETVVSIEGEHKAYISSNKLKLPFISFPGAGIYKEVIPTIKRWGTKRLIIVMDSDALFDPSKQEGKNEHVFKHLVEFAKKAIEDNIEVNIWVWDPNNGKGLDDLLISGYLPQEIDLRTGERRNIDLKGINVV